MNKIRIVTVIASTLLFFLFVLRPVVFGECSNALNFCGTWTYNDNTGVWECYGQAGTGVPCQPFGNICRWATDLGCGAYGGCDTGVCSGTPDPTSTPTPSSTPAPTTPPGSPTSTPGPTAPPPTPLPTTPAAAACIGVCQKGNIYDPEDIWHGGTYGNSQCNRTYMAGHFQYWPGGDPGSQGSAGDDNCAEQNNCTPDNNFDCKDVCCGPMWPAPTPVTLTASPLCTNTNSTWSWTGGSGSYDIQRQNSTGATAWNWQSTISGNSYTSSFASGFATGNYGIRVSSHISVPSWSTWVNIGRDVTAPATPGGLNLVCNTNGSLSASWSPAVDVGCGGLHSYPYWARLSTDPNFGSSAVIYSNGTWPDGWTSGITKSTPANAFGPGVTVYGRVRSRDTFDQQSVSSRRGPARGRVDVAALICGRVAPSEVVVSPQPCEGAPLAQAGG